MRTFTLVLILAAASTAAAQSITAHPTLFYGSENLDRGQYAATLNLGVDAVSGELAPGLTAEAFVSLNVTSLHEDGVANHVALGDNSSFLRLRWRPASWAQGDGLSLTVLPLHADRIYLGFEFPLVSPLGYMRTDVGEDGAQLRLDRAGAYAALAVRSSLGLEEQDHEQHRHATLIASGGYDLFQRVLLEAQLAHSDLGTNPEPQVLGTPLYENAGALRVTYHRGLPVGPMVDVNRYRNDPAFWEELLRPERYDDALSLAVSAEALTIATRGLANPSQGPLNTTLTVDQRSSGAALRARVKWRTTRLELRGQGRDLAWIQSAVPGFPPFYALSDAEQPSSELSATLAVDHQFLAPHLTVGGGFELIRPASFTTASGLTNQPATTVVVTDAKTFEVQPARGTVSPAWRARLTGRWDVERFSAVAEAFLLDDRNRTVLGDDVLGQSEPIYAEPRTVGFNLLVQARFP